MQASLSALVLGMLAMAHATPTTFTSTGAPVCGQLTAACCNGENLGEGTLITAASLSAGTGVSQI